MPPPPTFLELARERVVIFDGATGTNLQLRELGPDDFGGELYEGCNEMLCLTRPRRREGPPPVVPRCRCRRRRDELVRLASRSSSPSTGWQIEPSSSPASLPCSPSTWPVATRRPTGRASSPARSGRARSCRRSARSPSRSCGTPTRCSPAAFSPAGSISFSSRRATTLCRQRPPSRPAAERWRRSAGRCPSRCR